MSLTSREAIYQACPKRSRPIIMSTMAAMFGAVPLACGAPFPRRRSAALRWHDGCQRLGPTARVRIREQRRHGRERKPISTGSRARSIGIPSSATTTRNCLMISTTRNTFQFRTRESSILASLWSWISLVSSYPSITTKFATSSAEEVLTAVTRICWCGGAPSNSGTISRASPRRRLRGSGARRTGSNSARPKLKLLYLPVA